VTSHNFNFCCIASEIAAMVVTHPAQGTSTSSATAKKNRRRISRQAPRTTDLSILPTSTEDELMGDAETELPQYSAPAFPPLAPNADKTQTKTETRRIPIPPHRMTPLKKDWINIFGPLTEILGLQVRMNVQRRCVEARVCAIIRLFNAADESFRLQNTRRISELYRKVLIS
jgi:hypothetical protein